MIDTLRINRIKKISQSVTKKYSLYSNIKTDDKLSSIIISHPLKAKQGFLLPIPLEFVDSRSSQPLMTKIIKSYIRLFNLPTPGFIGDPDIGYEDYTIEEYMMYLKQKGFSSFLTHYLVNYLDEIGNKGGDFAFLRFVFLANMENGNSRHFSISFPFDVSFFLKKKAS